MIRLYFLSDCAAEIENEHTHTQTVEHSLNLKPRPLMLKDRINLTDS